MCPAVLPATPSALPAEPPSRAAGLGTRLAATLQAFGEHTGVHTDWAIDTQGPADALPPNSPLGELVLDTLQAALTNVARHSRAHQVLTRVRSSGSDLSLLVRDDGQGAPLSAFAPDGRTTLARLRARADQLGGWLQIDSHPGQGTQIILSLPLPFVPLSRQP